jgi:ABC-type spermidine/putrescine transport system permease subunit II
MRRKPRDLSSALLLCFGLLVFAFLFLPIFVIVGYSFNNGRLLVAFHEPGLDAYRALAVKQQIQDSIWVSLRVGVISAIVATALGSLAGVALARRPGRWAAVFLAFLALVLVTPEIVDAIALLPWFVWLGQDVGITPFNDGIVRLVVSHSIFSTAVVTFIVRARMAGIDETFEEAAADLYATPGRRFRQITLPLMMPAVLAGALLAFTLSLDNTVVSAFVQVSGSTPWPVYVLSAVRAALRPEIAAVSTLMLVLTFVALALVAVVLKRSGSSSTEIARTMTTG